MAVKKKPSSRRKSWTAANSNPGGTKSVGTKMLDVITKTSKFGIGTYNNGVTSRPGEVDTKRRARRTRKK